MKPSLLIAGLLAGLVAFAARGAEPEIECSGVLVAGSETRVALAKKGTSPAQWIMIGREFGDFTVTAFEAKTGVVVLTKDGQQFRIPLKESKVVPGGVEPPPEIKNAILNNLRQLSAAADQFYLENGRNTATFAELVGPSRYVKELKVRDGEDYSRIKFEQGKPFTVTTASGYTITYDNN